MRGAVEAILFGIGLGRLGEHPLQLSLDRLDGAVGRDRGVGLHLGPVRGHQADATEAGGPAQLEDLDEAVPECRLVLLAEPGDGRVVGDLVRRDHTEGDVLGAAPLDPAGGALADAVGVEEQRHHHLRVEGGGPHPAAR